MLHIFGKTRLQKNADRYMYKYTSLMKRAIGIKKYFQFNYFLFHNSNPLSIVDFLMTRVKNMKVKSFIPD